MSEEALNQQLAEMESFAVGITRQAGGILLEQFRKPLIVEYKSKGNTNPVTDADRRSEEFLREAILKEYPEHGVLAEEGSQVDSKSSDFIWVLDPLDGTVNYLNGLPVFGVSVGVLHRGEPVLGCIFTPSPTRSDGSVYHARRGNGAFRDGEAIQVYESDSPQRGKITVFPWSFAALYNQKKGLKGRIGELRSPGSVAYELAMTASGVIQYAIFTSPWVWDVAAGITLVTEAGGDSPLPSEGRQGLGRLSEVHHIRGRRTRRRGAEEVEVVLGFRGYRGGPVRYGSFEAAIPLLTKGRAAEAPLVLTLVCTSQP